MNGYNRLICAGNVTRKPELRYTPGGAAVCNFGLACNRSWKDDQGEKREEVTFIDFTAWGKQAETIAEYVDKGRPLLVEARLQNESWEDKETKQNRSKLTAVVETFVFLPDGKQNGSQDRGGQGKGRGSR